MDMPLVGTESTTTIGASSATWKLVGRDSDRDDSRRRPCWTRCWYPWAGSPSWRLIAAVSIKQRANARRRFVGAGEFATLMKRMPALMSGVGQGHIGTSGQEVVVKMLLTSLSIAMVLVCCLLLFGLRANGVTRAPRNS